MKMTWRKRADLDPRTSGQQPPGGTLANETGGGGQERPEQWWYTDPTGACQGPFHYKKMKEWYQQGFFKSHLPIRCHENTPFIPLGQWFASNNSAFCDEVPSNWREQTEYQEPVSTKPSNSTSLL